MISYRIFVFVRSKFVIIITWKCIECCTTSYMGCLNFVELAVLLVCYSARCNFEDMDSNGLLNDLNQILLSFKILWFVGSPEKKNETKQNKHDPFFTNKFCVRKLHILTKHRHQHSYICHGNHCIGGLHGWPMVAGSKCTRSVKIR